MRRELQRHLVDEAGSLGKIVDSMEIQLNVSLKLYECSVVVVHKLIKPDFTDVLCSFCRSAEHSRLELAPL